MDSGRNVIYVPNIYYYMLLIFNPKTVFCLPTNFNVIFNISKLKKNMQFFFITIVNIYFYNYLLFA